MSKFLGIEYNKWHGVISTFIMAVSFIVCPMFVADKWIAYLLSFSVGTFMVIMLQALGESLQAIDHEVEEKYGSFKNFQDNSRDDWAWCIKGLAFGIFVGTGIFIFIDKVL